MTNRFRTVDVEGLPVIGDRDDNAFRSVGEIRLQSNGGRAGTANNIGDNLVQRNQHLRLFFLRGVALFQQFLEIFGCLGQAVWRAVESVLLAKLGSAILQSQDGEIIRLWRIIHEGRDCGTNHLV